MAVQDVMCGESAQADAQVAAALARSAVNRTLGSPSVALNAMAHNPDPLDTDGQGSQTGPQDPSFMHSFAWLDLTGEVHSEAAGQHLVDVYDAHAVAVLKAPTHLMGTSRQESCHCSLCQDLCMHHCLLSHNLFLLNELGAFMGSACAKALQADEKPALLLPVVVQASSLLRSGSLSVSQAS